MKNVDRWLLPDGVEEILPEKAESVEKLRRHWLELYASWGYQLVIPPLMEFTESLCSGVGHDLDLSTFKITDQLSGRMMGLRADMTPQAARIDAHSFRRNGINRLCYAGHVLHTKPKSPLAIRNPLQAGAEIFGEPGLEADIEVVSLLLESLSVANVSKITLDLGHVGVYQALAESLQLTATQEAELFELLQTKDRLEIGQWISTNVESEQVAQWLLALMNSGDVSALNDVQAALNEAPAEASAAIDELLALAEVIEQRYPEVNLYVDLSELRGYHYHTGIVFAAYAEGFGDAIANGGRYDHIGEVFGRARPATGFGINLTSVIALSAFGDAQNLDGIYAPASDDAAQWVAIQALRAQGEKVICGLSPNETSATACNRELVLVDGAYQVKEK